MHSKRNHANWALDCAPSPAVAVIEATVSRSEILSDVSYLLSFDEFMGKDTLEAFSQKVYCEVLVFFWERPLVWTTRNFTFSLPKQSPKKQNKRISTFPGFGRLCLSTMTLSGSPAGIAGGRIAPCLSSFDPRPPRFQWIAENVASAFETWFGMGGNYFYSFLFWCNFPSFSLAIDCLVGRSFFFKCTRRYLLIWEILCQAFPELSLRISRMLKAGQLSLAFFDVKFFFLRTKRDILGVWKFWYWTLWGTIQETLNFKKITEPPGSFKFCSWKKWLKRGLIVWPCHHHGPWFLGSWKAKPNSPVPRNCAGRVSPRYILGFFNRRQHIFFFYQRPDILNEHNEPVDAHKDKGWPWMTL